jgi:ArsR family transcriptional regulator
LVFSAYYIDKFRYRLYAIGVMAQVKQMPRTSIAEGCCPGVTAKVACAAEREAKRWAAVFRALSDPTRLQILSLVARNPGGVCECNIVDCTPLSQPTISYHVKVLKEAGLLDVEKQGLWCFYRLRRDVLGQVAAALSGLGR